jgi:hypothetical protein
MKRITRFLPAIALITTVAGMLAFRPASESTKFVSCSGTLFVYNGNTDPTSSEKFIPANYDENDTPTSVACVGTTKICAICVGSALINAQGFPIVNDDGAGGNVLDDAIRAALSTGTTQSGGSGSSAFIVYIKN